MTNFEQLGLIEPILRALQEEGYSQPTPIQQQAIPIVLEQQDLLGCAQTGTGKTAAFALPILQLVSQMPLDNHKGRRPVKVLILTPTRELAIQIGDSFKAYGRHLKVRNTVIFGGVGQQPQTDALAKGPEVLIATPGRLLDLAQQGFIHLQGLGIFVLDEADRMLDMGFIHDVRRVIKMIPERRQTLFFSATMPAEIQKLADSILHQPRKVEVTPVSSTAETVQQSVYFADKQEKKTLLIQLLRNPEIRSALIFTRTKHGANKVAKDLNAASIKAEAIHGNKSQTARQTALANFKSGRTRVLVATDIAARGIDIDELSHVFNYELPNVPETYVHRIGRTGRAGASGIAIAFCDHEERAYLRDIEKLIGKKVPVVNAPEKSEQTAVADTPAPQNSQPAQPRQPQNNGQRQQPANERPNNNGNQQPRQPTNNNNGQRQKPTNERNDKQQRPHPNNGQHKAPANKVAQPKEQKADWGDLDDFNW
jgi:ATP-dependent RNA helicase RhlE